MTIVYQKVWQDPIYFMAFGFGTGLIPMAPGTWGTLAAIPLYLILSASSAAFYSFFVLLAFIFGIYICNKVSSELGIHDYPGIVWDEVVGYLLTMLGAPFEFSWMLIGFILFRVFDIWKPYPIRYCDQKVGGGFGIMLDDLLAAIPAWIILHIFILLAR